MKYKILLTCWSPRHLLHPALSSPQLKHRKSGNSESYLWKCEDDVTAILWTLGDSGYAIVMLVMLWLCPKMIFQVQSNYKSPQILLSVVVSQRMEGDATSAITITAMIHGTQCTNMQCNSNHLCNLNSSGCLTDTEGQAGSKSGSLPDSRSHVTSPTSPAPPKSPSRDATHIQFCSWGWYTHQKGLCVFPDLAKPHIKDPKLDLLTTS